MAGRQARRMGGVNTVRHVAHQTAASCMVVVAPVLLLSLVFTARRRGHHAALQAGHAAEVGGH